MPRPKPPVPPPSGTERNRAWLAGLRESGGRRVIVVLDPETTDDLALLRSRSKSRSDAALIRRLITDAARAHR